MAEQKTYTRAGYDDLIHQLEYWKEEREKNKKEISEARSYGDLSENSEYDEAKTNQARIAAKIAELEEMLAHAVVVDDAEVDHSKVSVGSIVVVKNITLGMEKTYHIVGSYEANPFEGKISDESAIGVALRGRGAGETVTVNLPNGKEQSLEILSVARA